MMMMMIASLNEYYDDNDDLFVFVQYWGAFASIGYYRFKTLHHPSLSLRVRRQLVSRAIAINWVISLLLAMTFSLANAHTSAYLPWTLDPFRHTYYLHLPREEGSTVVKGHAESHEAESDQVNHLIMCRV